jgi:hypothetical protein
LSSGFQRITGYITPKEELGIFQRRTGYITPEYFKEEPGISPPDISMKTGYITPGYVKEELGISPLKQLTGDNPVKKTDRQGDNLGKNN